MSTFGKIATLVLGVVVPVLAAAQTPQQAKPSPQQRPTAPAAAPGTAPAPVAPATQAPQTQPAVSPNSQRFVTSENFYRPTPRTQPASAAGTNPATNKAAAAAKPSTIAVPVRSFVPPVARPAVVSPVLDLHVPQPAPVQPVASTSSTPALGHDMAAVDYASGQLTVVAENAPLGFVLKLVAAKTGAVIDLAPELQNEPVVAHLGPSSVREVLTGLLDSPRVDYIVLGTGDEPGSLKRIMVRTRRSFGKVAMAATRPPQTKQEDADDEEQLDQNGRLVSKGAMAVESPEAQKQRMENWQKSREAMRVAEIKQQELDRENEKNAPPEPPTPPQDNPAENQKADNPPQQ